MRTRSRYKKKSELSLSLPQKANKILIIFFLLFLFIVLRIGYLCVFTHDKVSQEVMKPRQKIFIESAKRGGIYDRFGEPLAVNELQYNVGIFYPPIRQIPALKWKRKKKGVKTKFYPRREYISKLSRVIAQALYEDPERIEDLIHSKASLLSDGPLILKEGVSEQQYYRLKKLENLWPGIYCGMGFKRCYPQGKVACHLVGYMGAINKNEYEKLRRENKELTQFLKDWQEGYFPAFPNGFQTLDQVRSRLKELSKKRYSIYDWVGKAGLESKYDELLRGYYGQKAFYADAKGEFIRPMASTLHSLSGNRLTLSISAELQKYAEELLIENEAVREGRSIKIDPTNGSYVYQKQPWIKGGAIVVMDPNTGEVLALASCPRFDPNDFIISGDLEERKKKNARLSTWLENDTYIAQIWDQKMSLSQEVFDRKKQCVKDVETRLDLEQYLSLILPKKSLIKNKLLGYEGLAKPIELQRAFEFLLSLSGQSNAWHLLKVLYPEKEHQPYPKGDIPRKARLTIEKNLLEQKQLAAPYKKVLDEHFEDLLSHYSKLLLVDLTRLLVDSRRFAAELTPYVKFISLKEHRDFEAAYAQIQETVRKTSYDLFSKVDFRDWREANQKKFLQQKRKAEKLEKRYPKPYLDYLDEEKNNQFEDFWNSNKEVLLSTFLSSEIPSNDLALKIYLEHFALLASEIKNGAHAHLDFIGAYKKLSTLYEIWPHQMATYYLRTLRAYADLDRELLGSYRGVYPYKKATEKHLAKSFYPRHGYSYARSYAFAQATPQGSLFKLVTAYEALRQNTSSHSKVNHHLLNPLTFVDDLHRSKEQKGKWNVGFLKNGQPIPQIYKGGRLPRSHRKGIGNLEITDALAISSNPYFALLASEKMQDPNDLNKAAANLSFGKRTGLDLPGEIAGSLPKDLSLNRTGLYSYAIGHHTLVVSPLQTCVMLSALANGGDVLKPQVIRSIKGTHLEQKQPALLSKQDFSFKNSLALLGIDFPLFLGQERGEAKQAKEYDYKVMRKIDLPYSVQNTLFSGMQKAVQSPIGTAQPNRVRSYSSYHPVYQSYQNLKHQIIGKTSSAEVREVIDLDYFEGVNTYKHTWFGGIVFEEDVYSDQWKKPELVVVVYLRYGDFGREAAPLVSAIAQKWRKIKRKHSSFSEGVE